MYVKQKKFQSLKILSGDLTPSQFPVFTIYVQKTCLKSAAKCNAAWSFERVMEHDISATEIGKSTQADRAACMESCLLEDKCRSVTLKRQACIRDRNCRQKRKE